MYVSLEHNFYFIKFFAKVIYVKVFYWLFSGQNVLLLDFGSQNHSLTQKIINNQSQLNARLYFWRTSAVCHLLSFIQLQGHGMSSMHWMPRMHFACSHAVLLARRHTHPGLLCTGSLRQEMCAAVGVPYTQNLPDGLRGRDSSSVANYRGAGRWKEGAKEGWCQLTSNREAVVPPWASEARGRDIFAGTAVGSVDGGETATGRQVALKQRGGGKEEIHGVPSPPVLWSSEAPNLPLTKPTTCQLSRGHWWGGQQCQHRAGQGRAENGSGDQAKKNQHHKYCILPTQSYFG